MSKNEYDFIVGFTLYKPTGFKTIYRHFDNLEVAKMFASNKVLKDSSKVYVDLELYNKEKEKNQKIEEILDKDEKEYLSNIIKPFKDKITYISKFELKSENLEYISISYKDINIYEKCKDNLFFLYIHNILSDAELDKK